jgi:hypothetical protein
VFSQPGAGTAHASSPAAAAFACASTTRVQLIFRPQARARRATAWRQLRGAFDDSRQRAGPELLAQAGVKLVDLTGDTKTDSINRAIQIYAYIEESCTRAGRSLSARPPIRAGTVEDWLAIREHIVVHLGWSAAATLAPGARRRATRRPSRKRPFTRHMRAARQRQASPVQIHQTNSYSEP